MTGLPRELIGADRLAEAVHGLAERINRDYAGQSVMIVGVLKGSFMFLADLVRHVTVPVTIDFLRVSSYGAATESSGAVQIRLDLDTSVADRHVLVVEDIVDTGLTLRYLANHLLGGKPASLRLCTLLDKPSRRKTELRPDYVGFEIPDQFVVGYGLDHAERYRELPAICVLDPVEAEL